MNLYKDPTPKIGLFGSTWGASLDVYAASNLSSRYLVYSSEKSEMSLLGGSRPLASAREWILDITFFIFEK